MKTWKEAYHQSWQMGDDLDCGNHGLTSLEGAPARVVGNFICRENALASLKGAPNFVGEGFFCSRNNLVSLEGAPSFIGGPFYCQHNQLTSLKDIHRQIKHIGGNIYLRGNPIESHVLGLLLIDNLAGVEMWPADVGRILNKHLPSEGMESVLLCQEELILAGFDEYAQL